MAFSKSFDRELNRLFRQRTDWLRRKLWTSGAGKPPKFDRRKVDSGIRKLQKFVSSGLACKLARLEFNERVVSRKNYHVKGWSFNEKKEKFKKWFIARLGKKRGLIYAFWGNHGKCIYIGRTGSHGSRPSSHFKKTGWFPGVKRITIFVVKGQSHIPKLECLAIHRFQPTRNKIKAATKKWTKACPLCKKHKYINDELRYIFRLR